MSTGLPEEFLAGSKMLDEDHELLALGLMELSFAIASQYLDDKNFTEMLGIKKKGLFSKKTIDKKEENRMLIELIMINLFIVSKWIMKNYDSKPSEVLDRMFFHFRKAMSNNDLDFGMVTEERYLAYSKSLENQEGAGPAWWFGKASARFVCDKEVDPRTGLQLVMIFSQMLGTISGAVKKFVESGDYKKKA